MGVSHFEAIPSPRPARSWGWSGKHRLGPHGGFQCHYKAHKGRIDMSNVGMALGKVCPFCARLITSLLTNDEWQAYQAGRGRSWEQGTKRLGRPRRTNGDETVSRG